MNEMEQAEDNFSHERLIEAIENQIADGHPREAGLVMMALTANGESHDEVLVKMAAVLARHIALSAEKDSAFDISAYAAGLLELQSSA